jgi:hypothetical protein
MSTPERIIGRHNALEFGTRAGRRVARRYVVHYLEIRDGRVVDAEIADEPDEEIALPMSRDIATLWAWECFEDLGDERIADLVVQLVRPTGPLV